MLFISACHKIDPKQERANKLVRAYINSNHLNGQNKYETLNFGKLISMRASYLKTKDGVRLSTKMNLENDTMMKLDSQ